MSGGEARKPKKRPRIDVGLIERLEETARRLGIEVRYDEMQKPGYGGGLCRVRQRWILVINRSSLPLEKAELLAEAISTRETGNIYLPPDVREVVDWARGRKDEKQV